MGNTQTQHRMTGDDHSDLVGGRVTQGRGDFRVSDAAAGVRSDLQGYRPSFRSDPSYAQPIIHDGIVRTGDQRPVTLMRNPYIGVIGPVMGQGAVDVSGQVRMVMSDAGVLDTGLEVCHLPGDVVCD